MSFISASYSVKKLSDKRYTSENTFLTTEAFVSPFDINANEVYTDFRYIPTSSAGLPYSGSDQNLGIVSASVTDPSISEDVAVLKYWYRKKVKRGNQGGRSTWFFVEDDGFGSNDTVFSDQLITSSQQTNFISPKYIISDNANNTAEGVNPGYKIQVSVGTDAASATVVNNLTYAFDYKTGVLSFLPNQTPAAVSSTSNYVFISAYQYVGRTLSGQIADGSIGGGSGASSWTELTGIPENLISSSAQIASDISGSWQGQGFISASQVQENIGGGVVSGSAQIASDISGSTRIYVSGSNGGFDVGQDSTLKFVSGTAGVTVVSNGSDTITIGASTDDVNLGTLTLNGSSPQINSDSNLYISANNGTDFIRLNGTTLQIYNPAANGAATVKLITADSAITAENQTLSNISLGYNNDFGSLSTPTAEIRVNSREVFDSTTGGSKIVFSAIAATSSSLRHILELDSGEGYEGNFTAAGSIRALSGSNFVGNLIGTAASASSLTVTNLSGGTGDDEGSSGYGILFTNNTGSGVSVYSDQNSGLRWRPNSSTLDINALAISDNGTSISLTGFRSTIDLFNNNPGGADVINIGNATEEINLGKTTGLVNILGSASIAGDLTVQGTVTSIQTENLNVSDQFILLASGSTGTKDGGIIVQSGSNGVGTALYFDANSNRWAVNPSNSVNWNDTSLTPKQYVVSVSASAAAPPTDPLDFGTTNEYYGMMHVNTDNGDIYIYS